MSIGVPPPDVSVRLVLRNGPTSAIAMPSPLVASVFVTVTETLLLMSNESGLAPLLVSQPLLVQPLRSNVELPAPPSVRYAFGMPTRATFIPSLVRSDELVRTQLATAFRPVTLSTPPAPPVSVPVPVQPPTSKLLLLAPPVSRAFSKPDSTALRSRVEPNSRW